MPELAVIVGNPKPRSRTRELAEELGERIARLTGAQQLPTIDLIEHADELFRWPSESLDAIGAQVAAADYAIFATPTYKASYTGLLKSFLDRYPSNGLTGVSAVPVFTIGAPDHALAVEFTLRPLLVELGARVPTRGLSFETPKFDRRAAILDEWIEQQGDALIGAGKGQA
ncbi:NADPH-dependent FMN reductase [Leucobacter sp. GX24907]